VLVYCDSSALVKLILEEKESDEFDRWLTGLRDAVLVSCTLARTEVVRAVRRSDPEAVQDARSLLDELMCFDIDMDMADAAAALNPSPLRSLDAVHVAAALQLGPTLTAFVAYDTRTIEAARAAGLNVHHPGA
jgi:predicted nucleic acid-binding protein